MTIVLRNLRYEYQKRNHIIAIKLIKLLTFISIIHFISLDLNITMIASLNYYNSRKIINIKYIGEPSQIYIDNENIKKKQNFYYEYVDNYLKIKSSENKNYNIKLVWKSEISRKMIEKEKITEMTLESTSQYEKIDSTIISNTESNGVKSYSTPSNIIQNESLDYSLFSDITQKETIDSSLSDMIQKEFIDYSIPSNVAYNKSSEYSTSSDIIKSKIIDDSNITK